MMFSSLLLPLLLATAAARSSFFKLGNQVALDSKPKVPGDNPLHFCQSAEVYSLDIEKVDLIPNPPKALVDLVWLLVLI